MNKISTLLLLAGLSIANFSQAASSTGSLHANVTLNSTCIIQAQNVVFGAYNPANTSSTTGTISATCTKGTAFTIHNNILAYTVWNGYPVGIMSDSNGNPLYFQQYVPGVTSWLADDGTSTDEAHYYTYATGTGAQQSFSYQYRILPNQYVTPGSYSVNEIATVSF